VTMSEDTYSLLLSCFDPENHEFDMAKMENLKKSRRSESIESVGVVTKKPYVQRRVYSKRDPCNTNWYQEYVVNINGTWSNPLHRDFNLFRRRFVIDQPSFIELVNTIRSLTDMNGKFWNVSHRNSKPVELLILGSLRILARNWTLDDCAEQTCISVSTFSVFFPKFVKW
jgi:hypothetical protein